MAAEIASGLLRRLYRKDSRQQQRLETALRSMPHNITIDMGLALYHLARSLEQDEGRAVYDDLSALERRIRARSLSEAFLREWDAFIDAYGFRGPTELDLAAVRYADDYRLALEQMRQFVLVDESVRESPQQAFDRRQQERRDAFQALIDNTTNAFKARLTARLYRVAAQFSGLRESHKYHLVMGGYQVRRRALEAGQGLADHGQLDSAAQVFDLTYADLSTGLADPEADMRDRITNNTRYRRQVARTPGAHFPVIVDSRGRIPRPPVRAAGPGVFAGVGVSSGRAQGPAKVLHHVGEKPVLPGEVLLARATDPGWTPLFVHAAGVVLETGGSFQHGALVAREYGTPCVVDIADATEQITDGQVVEIDGTSGTLTYVSPPGASHA